MTPSAWLKPDYSFTAEQYLATLDQHGVHFGVIAGISIYGLYNDYMLEELRKHRRLRGTAIVAPTTDRHTLERMKADGVGRNSTAAHETRCAPRSHQRGISPAVQATRRPRSACRSHR